MNKFTLLLAAIVSTGLWGCESPETNPSDAEPAGTVQDLSAAEAQAIAREAYVYGFPMVMGYKTMYAYVIDQENADYKGPFNQVSCEARLFTPADSGSICGPSRSC